MIKNIDRYVMTMRCREALTSAFHVLRRSTKSSAGANCRDVIIIVSDVRDTGCRESEGRLFRVDICVT